MVDNGVKLPVIGVAFDGTGYGTDGHIWGGEFLVADYRSFDRKGHLEYLPLPGGAAAIQKPYRIAISYLLTLCGEEALKQNLNLISQVDDREISLIEWQIKRGINCPLTSSCGRLFDAVSALLGIRSKIDYEGQAAVELEMIASEDEVAGYPFTIEDKQGVKIIFLKGLVEAILFDLRHGQSATEISAKFHATIAQIVTEMCQRLSGETGITTVALSGGVFQNRLLLRKTVAHLEARGFTILTHRQVPSGDGGISVGQAAIANFADKNL
jgi:hydrogenase maturation protein HypF